MEKVFAALEPVLNIIEAILLLACAFIVASIFKKLALRGLSKTKLRAQLYEEVAAGKQAGGAAAQAAADGSEPAGSDQPKEVGDAPDEKPKESSLAGFLGALIYLIVFLLFIPAIFSLLGIRHASAPITNMLQSFWDHLPNILACIVILVVGFMLAKLVRQLLIPIFRRLKIDKLQEKAGVETTTDKGKLSSTLAYIVYVLILIPIIISALRSLHIPAISNPAIQMLNKIFDFIPSIIVAVLILVIGNVIARFAGQITSRLIEAGGLDEKVSRFVGNTYNYPLSKIIGTLVHVIIMVFFIVQSFSVLGMETFNNIGNAVINYVPYALSAVVILGVCFFAASAAKNAVSKVMNPGMGKVVYFAVWVVGIFMALNQLGIAKSLVNMAFTAIAGAAAIAVAIAFGVGGKDFAARLLEKLAEDSEKQEKKKNKEKDEE